MLFIFFIFFVCFGFEFVFFRFLKTKKQKNIEKTLKNQKTDNYKILFVKGKNMKELKLTPEKHIKERDGKLWIQKQYKSVNIRFSTRLDNTPENYQIVSENLGKLFIKHWNKQKNLPESAKIQIERDVCEEFIVSFGYYVESKTQDSTLAPATLVKIKSLFSILQDEKFFKEKGTAGLTLDDLEMYAFLLDKAKQSKNTIKYKITHILAAINMFRKIFKLDLLDSRLLDISKFGKDQDDGDILNEDDIKEILEEIKETNDKELILYTQIAANTGAREGEILALNKEDIDLENNTITLKKTTTIGNRIKDSAKTSSGNRVIPIINPTFREFLESNLRKIKGNRLLKTNANKMRNIWYSFLEMVNRPKIHLEKFRHSVATIFCGKTLDFASVAGFLGHSSPATTFNNYIKPQMNFNNLCAIKVRY